MAKVAYADDPVQHDNYFCPDNTQTGETLSFQPASSDWYSVTDKNYWGGVSNVSSGKYIGCIDVKAAQENSSDNAGWAKGKVTPFTDGNWDRPFVTDTTSEPGSAFPPKELDFAIYGTLYYTDSNRNQYTCENVTIGQGATHAFGLHNWWVFNNNSKYHNSILCKDSSGNDKYLYPSDAGSYDYYMRFSAKP